LLAAAAMADWDPFAVDEQPDAPAAPAPAAVEAAKTQDENGEKVVSLEKEDMNYVSEEVLRRLKASKPWETPLDPKPDLLWHTPTCTLADWRHQDVKVEVGTGIAYVIFNRPNENNSLQDTINFGTNDALYGLHERKEDIRVAVFTGEGRMYCSGGDPKSWQSNAARLRGEYVEGDGTVANRCVEAKEMSPEVMQAATALQMRAFYANAFKFGPVSYGQLCAAKQWHTWYTLPQFTISLVNGSAMGGGVGCVCCCDYVIAVKKAYFVLSEVKIGVIPATISPYVIAKIGTSNAKRFFCAAENLTAARAKEFGIVDEVVDNMKEGHERIKEIVKAISEIPPRAVESYKEIVAGTSGVPYGKALVHYMCRKQAMAADGKEVAEGLAAAAEKRLPAWAEKPIGFEKWPMVGVGSKNQ